jgi:lysophospholipase L1-like esterase
MKRILILLSFFLIASGYQTQRPIHIFMIGDSTMANKKPVTEPERGWGQMLQLFFTDEVKVSNHAVNGRSSKSFLDEGLWQVVLDSLQKGDYVIIQFGHNDQKADSARHTDPYFTYKSNLEKYVNETMAKGAIPILCTSIVRRKFDEKGNLTDTHGEYPAVTRLVAREMDVPLLDLQIKTKNLVSDLGPEKSKVLYLHTAPGEYPNRPDGVKDDTHLCIEGATMVARMAIEAMEEWKLPVTDYLKK